MIEDPQSERILWETYERLLADLRAIIAAGRGRAAAAINQELVATYLTGQLYQTSGRLLNSGGGQSSGTCAAGDEVTTSVAMVSQLGSAYKAGPAQLAVSAYQFYCDEYSCYYADAGQLTTTVRLVKR